MPTYGDMRLVRQEDGLLAFAMAPPTSIAGWTIQCRISKRFGADSSGLMVASAASGYGNGVSGITITNSGNGTMTVPINSLTFTSGLSPGNYAYAISRLDSGYDSVVGQGFLLIGPR